MERTKRKEGRCPRGEGIVDKLYCDSFCMGEGCKYKNECFVYLELEDDYEKNKISELRI